MSDIVRGIVIREFRKLHPFFPIFSVQIDRQYHYLVSFLSGLCVFCDGHEVAIRTERNRSIMRTREKGILQQLWLHHRTIQIIARIKHIDEVRIIPAIARIQKAGVFTFRHEQNAFLVKRWTEITQVRINRQTFDRVDRRIGHQRT